MYGVGGTWPAALLLGQHACLLARAEVRVWMEKADPASAPQGSPRSTPAQNTGPSRVLLNQRPHHNQLRSPHASVFTDDGLRTQCTSPCHHISLFASMAEFSQMTER